MKETDSTTIRITYATKDKLSKRGAHGDSFDAIIQKLLRKK